MKRLFIGPAMMVIGGIILVFAGCSSGSDVDSQKTPEQVQQETREWVLENVASACDQFGNRVYKWQGYKSGGLHVIPNDPTCKEN